MTSIKNRIELFFEQFTRTIYHHPLTVLVIMALFIGTILFKIPALTIDTSGEALLHRTDPSRLAYDAFRDQFGQDRMIIITITSDRIFSQPFFERLHLLHRDMETRVPFLKEVTSLINIRNTRGEKDRLLVEDLLAGWPEDKTVDFDRLRRRVLADPFYRNHVISAEGKTTAVVLETDVHHSRGDAMPDALDNFGEDTFAGAEETRTKRYLSPAETGQVVSAVRELVREYQAPGFSLAVTGGPVVLDTFNKCTMKDLRQSFVISLVGVVMLLLAILLRRLAGVVLPTLIVLFAALSALGLMGWSGVPIKMTTTVLPAFLMCVGVADAVHILAIFFKRIDSGYGREDAIVYAMGHSGLAITLTSLTTAAALLSFSFAELTAMGDLGLFAAAGVLLALLYTVILLPVLLALVPVKPRRRPDVYTETPMDRFLLWTSAIAIRYPRRIIVISLVIFALSFYLVFNLRYSEYIVERFPDSMPVKQDIRSIETALNGILRVEAVVDTGRENGIYEPDLLHRIERTALDFERYRSPDIFVGKVYSINNILKETHQALHANDPDFYRLPRDYNTIAQEFLLFENAGAEELESIVDSQFSKTRISFKIPWVDAVVVDRFIQALRQYTDIVFADRAEITITGMSALMARTVTAALDSMTRSYLLAFGVIALMMILLVGDIKLGLFSMIPNLFPIFLTLGIMGAVDVPLDITSLMIASIAMGLVVDDTVHFIYNFKKYYLTTGDAPKAIRLTLIGVGRAILITSVVLSCGFFVLMTATLTHIVRFGFFTGLTILFALAADFLLAPALMMTVTGTSGRKKPLPNSQEVIQ